MGTISTAIPSPEYQPLLDAVHAAADICEHPRPAPQDGDARSVGAFGLHALARWTANVQAFILLRNAKLLTDAYAIARVGSELAVMSAWVEVGVSNRFATPAARAKALIEDGTYTTRIWLDKMHERTLSTPRAYDATTPWGRALIAAKKPESRI